MKKIILIILAFFIFGYGFSSGTPVVDISHILETIYNGSQIYQQVQNTIQQLKYQYEQTKAQLQNLMAFDYNSIDSFSDAVSFVDENLSFLRNTEDSLKNMRITIGNNSYDLLSIYKIPGGIFDEMTDLWMTEMSDEEKAKAWSRYGLDPRNYAYAQTWKTRINKSAQKLSVLAETIQERIEKNGKKVEQIISTSRVTESTVGQLQANNELMGELIFDIKMLNSTTQTIGSMIGDKFMAEEYIPPEIKVSDNFFMKYQIPDLTPKGDRN